MGSMDHLLVFLSTPISFREQVPDQMIGLHSKGFVPRLDAFFLRYRVTHRNTPFSKISLAFSFLSQQPGIGIVITPSHCASRGWRTCMDERSFMVRMMLCPSNMCKPSRQSYGIRHQRRWYGGRGEF